MDLGYCCFLDQLIKCKLKANLSKNFMISNLFQKKRVIYLNDHRWFYKVYGPLYLVKMAKWGFNSSDRFRCIYKWSE